MAIAVARLALFMLHELPVMLVGVAAGGVLAGGLGGAFEDRHGAKGYMLSRVFGRCEEHRE